MVLEKVAAGEPFDPSAEMHNATVDTIVGFRRHQQAIGAAPIHELPRVGYILVQNDSGGTVPRFGVLGLGDPPILPTTNLAEWQNRIVLKGTTPATADHLAKFAVLLEPLAAGKVGPAVISGVVNMQVNIDAAWHEFADVEDTVATHLKSRPYGAGRILWAATGTGIQYASVLLGPPGGQTWWRATLGATLNQGSTANATLTGPGAVVSVTDNYLGAAESIASAEKIGVQYDFAADTYYATEAEC